LVSVLAPAKRAAFKALRTAAQEVESAEAELKAGQDEVNARADTLREAMAFRAATYPPMSFHQLHLSTFPRGRPAPPPPPRRHQGDHNPATSAYEAAKAARTRK